MAVAESCGEDSRIKWPNDVLVGGRKVAGILAEGRPHEGWAVLGIGVNVAVDVDDLPEELREKAGSLGRARADVEPFLSSLLGALERALALPVDELLGGWRARDALLGSEISWTGGTGVARGIDGEGRLVVELPDGGRTALNAGEVHLGRLPAASRGPGRDLRGGRYVGIACFAFSSLSLLRHHRLGAARRRVGR